MVEKLTAERDAWKALAMALYGDWDEKVDTAEEALRALGLDPLTGERL